MNTDRAKNRHETHIHSPRRAEGSGDTKCWATTKLGGRGLGKEVHGPQDIGRKRDALHEGEWEQFSLPMVLSQAFSFVWTSWKSKEPDPVKVARC